jgi:hypothetical protein
LCGNFCEAFLFRLTLELRIVSVAYYPCMGRHFKSKLLMLLMSHGQVRGENESHRLLAVIWHAMIAEMWSGMKTKE